VKERAGKQVTEGELATLEAGGNAKVRKAVRTCSCDPDSGKRMSSERGGGGGWPPSRNESTQSATNVQARPHRSKGVGISQNLER